MRSTLDIAEWFANLEEPDWVDDTPVADIWSSVKQRVITGIMILDQIERGTYEKSDAEGDLEDMETNPDGFRDALERMLYEEN